MENIKSMGTLDLVRQEIERHRQAIRVLNEHTAPEQTSKTCAIFQYSDTILSELLSFLDTLSEEPDKSLEEAAENYRRESCNAALKPHIDGPMPEYGGNVKAAFIAGAKWQAEQDERERADLFTIVALDAAQRATEQMMKGEVEGFIFQSEDYYPKELIARYDGELKHGDKVRIIVCKKEE